MRASLREERNEPVLGKSKFYLLPMLIELEEEARVAGCGSGAASPVGW